MISSSMHLTHLSRCPGRMWYCRSSKNMQASLDWSRASVGGAPAPRRPAARTRARTHAQRPGAQRVYHDRDLESVYDPVPVNAMKRSEHRILTTHVGSLPRPPALRDLLVRQDRGEAVDGGALAREAEAAVRYVISKQLDAGVDVGNDGEQPRVGFSTYPAKRMRGFGGASKRRMSRDIAEHPDYMARLSRMRTGAARINDAPQAVAEVAYTDLGEATCAGTSAGETTTVRTPTTSRWSRSCRSSIARGWARSPCRSPARGTSMS